MLRQSLPRNMTLCGDRKEEEENDKTTKIKICLNEITGGLVGKI